MCSKIYFSIKDNLKCFKFLKIKPALLDATQLVAYSLIFSHIVFIPSVYAGPAGGNVVGGSGSISQSGLNTTINQTTGSMAINWDSYNLSANERVLYIQPDSSSLSLNRILSHNGSQIHGRIDANGHVILVNPNGVFFGEGAQINVGGLIASGLDISPVDFMNGDYIFNEVLGTDGTVINNGLINASLGGNVTLLGKQVVNKGVISATLGSVNLAAGKAAVLTFDNRGLLGVKITKEVLQDELGIDPAVLNSGEITAEGGRILLTASVSQDVFSQAVNTGDIEQASSVVIHEDGSFTLGGGADVINTGLLDVSTTENNQNAGQIVVLGENVTSSGVIKADAENANGGDVELHATNTVLLTDNSQTSARSENSGIGGVVKVLGHHVGLFDQASVDVSGANGGGQALIGGDYQGENTSVRNAKRTFVAKNSRILADALNKGDGGKVIVWADESTQFYGDIFARGGVSSGNGGFAEVSGKEGLIFSGFADLTATFGGKGLLLLDPKNITISTDPTSHDFNIPGANDYDKFSDISSKDTILNNGKLAIQLNSSDVLLRANTDINVNDNVVATSGLNNLTLEAGRSINIASGVAITLTGGKFTAKVNHESAKGGDRDPDDAVFNMGAGSSIITNGGDIKISTGTFDSSSQIGNFTLQTLNSTGSADTNAGAITVTNSKSNIDVKNQLLANGGAASNESVGRAGGAITLTASEGTVTIDALVSSDGSNGGTTATGKNGGDAGVINIKVGNQYIQNAAISAVGGAKSGTGTVGTNGNITINGDNTSNTFRFNTGTSLTGGAIAVNGLDGLDAFNISAIVAAVLDGGNGTDTLTANNVANTWLIDSLNGGEVTGMGGFSNIENLVGNANTDTFTFTGGTIVGTVNGAGGNDTLTADNVANTWQIDSLNGGEVTGTGGFSNIENLVGNANTDTFTFTGGTIVGTVNGAGGNDTLTADNVANTWLIDSLNGGEVTGTGGFSNIENLVGNANTDTFTFTGGTIVGTVNGAGGNDTLTADNVANTWLIDSLNGGNVTGTGGFSNIENLIGNDSTDAFTISGGSIVSIDGAGGINSLTGGNSNNNWALSSSTGGSVTNANSFSNIANLTGGTLRDDFVLSGITSYTGSIDGGGGANDSITGGNTTNTWIVTGLNSGTTTAVSGGFINVENLIGNAVIDNFVLNGGTLTGSVDGAGGTDTLTANNVANIWTISATNGGAVTGTGGFSNIENLIGNASTDAFTISGGSIVSIDGAGGINSLTGDNSNNTWTLSSSTGGSVTSVTNFSNLANLTGGTLRDDFVLSGITSYTGSIDGGGGANDSITGGNTTNTWIVTGLNSGTTTAVSGGFINVENLIGNAVIDNFVLNGGTLTGSIDGAGGSDSLTANNVANTWLIDSLNGGDVTGIGGFSNTENLVGNANTDNFTINGGSIESIDGAGGTDTLTADDNPTNNWSIAGVNSGAVTDVASFNGIQNLIGGANTDIFVLSGAGTVIGSIDGKGGINSLTANNTNNTWNILANNTGTLTNTNGFTNIQNITGGTLTDTINFTAIGSSLDGLIDGGLGIDSLNIVVLDSNVTVQLGSAVNLNIIVDNVESITANAAQTNTIIAENNLNTWIIDGIDTGSIENSISPTPESSVRFANFSNITGGANDDVFRLLNTGSISGVIDGGDHNTFDSVDYSAQGTVIVQLDSAFGDVQNAERLIGNNTNSTLVAENDVDNIWNITGVNDGDVGSVIFVDFNILQGGNQQDTFNVNGGSAIINAGAGDDILNVTLSSAENGTIVFDGETHSAGDVVNFLGGSAGYVGDFNSNVTGSNDDRFVYTNAGNTFSVTYKNTESVQDDLIANTLTVNGTAANDSIDLDNQVFTVNGAQTVNYNSANKNNLTVDGLASNDIINISGDFSVTNTLTLITETVDNSSASTITANELVISNVTNAGTSTNKLLTDINDLSVLNSGSVFVQDVDSINVSQLINASLLELSNATGDITDGSALISSGELKLMANSGNILLDDNNQLSGPLSLVATLGDVTLNNTVNSDLALVDTQNLTVTSSGQITDSGSITATGNTTLTTAGAVALDSANNFNSLTVNNAASLVINDIDTINIVSIDTTGSTSVTSNGIALGRVNASAVNLNAGSGQITDTNGDNVNVTSGSVVMRATSGIGSGDTIETSTAELDVINNTGGQVKIKNTGNVLLTNLVNNGDIDFKNDTNVTIDHVDAGFTVGTFRLDVANGSVFGVDRAGVNFFTVPDITADAAFVTVNGEFGTFARPIVLKLNSEFFLASTVSSTFFIPQPPPVVNDTSDLQLSVFDSLNSVSGQRLIEIESIADINPAIFTDLHNYNQENISIRLPRDQMFEDELENYDRL